MEVTKNGDIINWTIIITNEGPSVNTNVKVQDSLAPGLIYQSYTIGPPIKGTFNMSTGLWTVGTQNVGVSYKILIRYKVVDISLATAESGAYGFTLSAVVSGDNVDPNNINNTKTAFVGITTCAPSAGAVNDIPACLCGSVATNDTPCSHGETEYRLTVGSQVNLDPGFTLNVNTGEYNAMGKIIDPYAVASFTYSIWCIVGADEFQTSGPAPVELPALFPVLFTDSLELLTGANLGKARHTALDGTVVDFNLGWTTVTEDSGTGDLIFLYPDGNTVTINLGSVTDPGDTVFPSVITASLTLTNLTLRNYNKVNDSSGAIIGIVLPDPATLGLAANRTRLWTFKRINVRDTGTITLTPNNLKTIDGQASYAFTNNDYQSVSVWTDGVNYFMD